MVRGPKFHATTRRSVLGRRTLLTSHMAGETTIGVATYASALVAVSSFQTVFYWGRGQHATGV